MNLRFEHVVVLMLENRSFDHLFGFLGKGEGVPAGAVNYRKAGDTTSTAFKVQRGGDFTAVGEGPSHSLKQTNEQLFGTTGVPGDNPASDAKMSGFVASFSTSLQYDLKRAATDSELQQVMNCFDPVQLPVLSKLANEFVLCDHWFADVPGPTMPNRAFVHAATSQGYTYNANWKPQFSCATLYDRISKKAGMSWRIYSHDQNDVLQLYPYVEKDVTNNVDFESHFLNDVANDNLPTYSFIDPAFMNSAQHMVNSMHAPADVRPAEKLVADVYMALRTHEAVFKKTLLIILFDEHGGYYDHVTPPPAVSPDGIPGITDKPYLVPFSFNRLGLRVPSILVSPWFKPEVDTTVYSHASIPGSVIDAFELGAHLTERDRAAAKLTERYLVEDGKRTWRTDIPIVEVPVQPKSIDATQREILEGAVQLDPHPAMRDVIRTHDIVDSQQAGQFMRVQVAKHLEHHFASEGTARPGAAMSAQAQVATSVVSPARIAELVMSRNRKPEDQNRP